MSKSKKSLSVIQQEINKIHGDNTIVSLSDSIDTHIDRIPTGILALDRILGGGFPVGKMVELYGNHGSGKSSIATRFMAEAQQRGKCVLIDLENAFDPLMAENSGVNLSDLMVAQPESAESALEMVEMILGADDVSAVVIDSVAGLVPRAEIEGSYGDAHVGLVARLISQAMRKLAAAQRSEGSDVIVVWINQIREKIGSMGYGPQTDSTGGRGLKFWCSTRVDVARTGAVKQGDDIIGHTVKVKTTKNRFAPPFQTATFDILYDSGISNESTLLDLAIDAGLIKKSGAWFADAETGENLGQGKLKVLERMVDDKDLYDRLMDGIGYA
jgi:recombination protein RecA